MKTGQEFPDFDERFPELDHFIIELTYQHQAGNITSWNGLAERVHVFFTDQRMAQMESLVPHWCKMASYVNGRTLVHVMCAFMGLYRMPEFLKMSPYQQQLMKWIILLHDVEKQLPDGKRDHGHAFRSTGGAAGTLPNLGFPVTQEYSALIADWDAVTRSALTIKEDTGAVIQDNRKLPRILDGIQKMFGDNTPATLILKTVLLHQSINMNFWPPAAPISNEEVRTYVDRELASLLLVMNLADNDGWNLFHAEACEKGRLDTVQVFEEIEELISQGA